MPKLIFHDSDGIDKTVQLGTEPVFIGRASDCQIQTHDAMVSRKHARITWDGNYWIEDLGSANGVFLGADKITRSPLRPGDVVTCGSLIVRMMPETRRPGAPIDEPRPVPSRSMDAVDAPRGTEREFDESIRTSSSPAQGMGESKLKAELEREIARREQAEQALLSAEQRAADAEGGTRELVKLRYRVEQLQEQIDQGIAAPQSIDLDEVGEAVALFNDALAELKASLRAAVDEAALLTAPAASVRVVRDSMRSATDELERARGRLRDMSHKLGLRE